MDMDMDKCTTWNFRIGNWKFRIKCLSKSSIGATNIED